MTEEELELPAQQAKAVTAAVAILLNKGFPAKAIFEGAIKGGAVALIAQTGIGAKDFSDRGMGELEHPHEVT